MLTLNSNEILIKVLEMTKDKNIKYYIIEKILWRNINNIPGKVQIERHSYVETRSTGGNMFYIPNHRYVISRFRKMSRGRYKGKTIQEYRTGKSWVPVYRLPSLQEQMMMGTGECEILERKTVATASSLEDLIVAAGVGEIDEMVLGEITNELITNQMS